MNCRIIEDLLPLYLDDACSEESRQAVEEHLVTCEKCREKSNKWRIEYEVLSDEGAMQENLREGELLLKRERAIKKETRKSIFCGVVLSDFVLLVAILIMMFRYLIQNGMNYILQQSRILSVLIPYMILGVVCEGIFLAGQYILKKEMAVLRIWLTMLLGMQVCAIVIGIVFLLGMLLTGIPVCESGCFMI